MLLDAFKKQVKMLFKVNIWIYFSDTVWIATKISQIGVCSTTKSLKLIYEFLVGELPKQWFSTSTLAMWHKDVSQIQVKELLFCIQKVSSYGVMIDESARGETKHFILNKVLDLLNEQEFEKIIQDLEQELEKAIEHSKK
ncbi:45550_t:CDS:2 [Gigaspora margarita]|uniref:45550_t:CDS:1 n=1 Tax=Gigaspora margarita TaxID=4874 RepID=A0ABN7VUM4_GIGMA|nr:45550_t:CDS:2 [Gigaspora margarita]